MCEAVGYKVTKLHRVRVTNSLLRTKQLLVDRTTTVLDLKRKLEQSFAKWQHEWRLGPSKRCFCMSGATARTPLPLARRAADLGRSA